MKKLGIKYLLYSFICAIIASLAFFLMFNNNVLGLFIYPAVILLIATSVFFIFFLSKGAYLLLGKKKLIISIILLPLLILFFVKKNYILSAIYPQALSCEAVAELPGVQLKGVSRIDCKEYRVSNQNNKKVYYLDYVTNTNMDCASGCINNHSFKIYDADDKKLYSLHKPTIWSYPHSSGNLPLDCGTKQNTKISVYKTEDKFYWMVEFIPYDDDLKYGCEVAGYYIYDGHDYLLQDKTTFKYYDVDCNDESQALKYLNNSQMFSEGDLVSSCYFARASLQKNCDFCNFLDFNHKSKCLSWCK